MACRTHASPLRRLLLPDRNPSRDRLTADQVSAMSVRDGERIAPRAVACIEVAFEVHAPELIRCCDFGEWFRVRCCAPLPPLWTGEAGSSENVAEGACRRPINLGIEHFQSRLELTCSPRWVFTA